MEIVDVQIVVSAAGIERVGFGTMLIMSNEANTVQGPTAARYSSVSEMTSAGFSATGVTVLAATAYFSQQFKPTEIVVGKRANSTVMSRRLTPIPVADTLYRVTINGTNFDFTSDATPTVAEITAGLETAINAGSEPVTATDNTTSLDLDADNAGEIFTLEIDRLLITQDDLTPDPGVAADLATIRTAADGDDSWYGVILDHAGTLEQEALSGAIQSIPKLFIPVSADDDIVSNTAGNLAETLNDLALNRTGGAFHHTKPHQFPNAALFGRQLPQDPGSSTFKFKTLVGVEPVTYGTTEITNLQANNANFYRTVKGRNITCDGKLAGGVNGFLDVTWGVDFLTARMEENIFAKLVTLEKVPFSDRGIGIVESEVRAVLALGVANDIILPDSEDTPIVVQAPRASEVSSVDKANRLLPDVTFSAFLAGAIHNVQVQGTLIV